MHIFKEIGISFSLLKLFFIFLDQFDNLQNCIQQNEIKRKMKSFRKPKQNSSLFINKTKRKIMIKKSNDFRDTISSVLTGCTR